ncbi:MAG TPA: hypothetical protein VHO69_06505 [Phototrophicaceae bacterium]|nr:hypothetical protein [Phototrophicaceae bacterium]
MALVLWGIGIVVITELLSRFDLLTPLPLAFIWSFSLFLAIGCLYQRRTRLKALLLPWPHLPFLIWLLVGVVSVLIITVGIVALVAPPNTYDVLTYHLPRVFYWAQFHSLAPYPAQVIRQAYQPPLAEFLILHTYLLAGTDQWANLDQWLAWVAGGIGVSWITAQLGGRPAVQWFSLIIALTTPSLILQASSAKNDLMAALWVICLVSLVIAALRKSAVTRLETGLMGAAAGLAILTKGTGYIYVFPPLVWLALALIWRRPRFIPRCQDIWQSLQIMYGIGLVILAVNAGHYGRNFQTFGTILTPDSPLYNTELLTPASAVSGSVRNLVLNLYFPDSLDSTLAIRPWLNQRIGELHQWLGLAADDPRTTYPYAGYPGVPAPWEQVFYEDVSGNLFQVFFILIALGSMPFMPGLRRRWKLIGYIGVVISQWLLLGWLLKWQIWGTRLQATWFFMIAPVVGLVFAQWRKRWLLVGLSGWFLLTGIFWAVNTVPRLIIPPQGNSPLSLSFYVPYQKSNIALPSILSQPRASLYFMVALDRIPLTQALVQQVTPLACQQIGLTGNADMLVYPIMVYIKAAIPNVHFQDVNVTNGTHVLEQEPPFRAFQPCAVIEIKAHQNQKEPRTTTEIITVRGRQQHQVWENDAYRLFLPLAGE